MVVAPSGGVGGGIAENEIRGKRVRGLINTDTQGSSVPKGQASRSVPKGKGGEGRGAKGGEREGRGGHVHGPLYRRVCVKITQGAPARGWTPPGAEGRGRPPAGALPC